MKSYVLAVSEARKDKGMTIRALARKSGIKETALGAVLREEREMKADELLALAEVLGLSLRDLLPGNSIGA